jgi:hypothetical protein
VNISYSPSDQVDIGINFDDKDSDKLKRIIRGPVREALERFARKNRGYKSAQARFPGSVTGEYYQIERKVGKLWAGFVLGDGDAFKDEPASEVLDDLIGHCLLMKDHLNRNELR